MRTVELEGQYKQARQVLRRLQREYPKDARVWYFSALANALVSGAWEGETEVLVKKELNASVPVRLRKPRSTPR